MERTRWRRRGIGGVLVGALLSAFLVVLSGSGPAEAAPRKLVSGWIPYWSTGASVASLRAQADLFRDVSPFWHSATGITSISDQETEADRAVVLGAARSAGVPVIPSVTDGTSNPPMRSILGDPSARAQHVASLVSLVMSRGYDGIDLDYEKFAFSDAKETWPTTRAAWVQFIAELSGALHARGKLLAVSIPPTYNSSRASGSGYWVYDYAGIAPYVDRVRIMTYDYSVSRAGPIAPLAWVDSVARYAVSQIPSSKIHLGVPTYGRDWLIPESASGPCPASPAVPASESLTSVQAQQRAAGRGISPTWDVATAEKTYSYQAAYSGLSAGGAPVTCLVTRTVWYEDSASVAVKRGLLSKYNLGGFAFWTLGGEDPLMWNAIREFSSSVGLVPQTPAGEAPSGGAVGYAFSTLGPSRGWLTFSSACSGALVRQIPWSAPGGPTGVWFDGRDLNGRDLQPGLYRVSLRAEALYSTAWDDWSTTLSIIGSPPPQGQCAGVVAAPLADKPVLFRDGLWIFSDGYDTAVAGRVVPFGLPGDVPVTGDWDGNGTVTIGIFRAGLWALRNSNTPGPPDVVIQFGTAGDVPVVGKWTGGASDSVGIFRAGTWGLRYSLTGGWPDAIFNYGQAGDVPITGRFLHDQPAGFAIFRNGIWWLRSADGGTPALLSYGSAQDRPLEGDWDGNGTSGQGLYRSGNWLLNSDLTSSWSQRAFGFGGGPRDQALTWR